MLFNHVDRVEIRSIAPPVTAKLTQDLTAFKRPPVVLPPSAVTQVGFRTEDSLLPYRPSSFTGYGLRSEYFAFPQKFLFADPSGLDLAAPARFGSHFEIQI